MKRLLGLVFSLGLVGLVAPATACMNDNESPTHEREFRSQYGQFAGLHSTDEPASPRSVGSNVLLGGGAVLLVGAFALVAKRSR